MLMLAIGESFQQNTWKTLKKHSQFIWENEGGLFQFTGCNQEAFHLGISFNAAKC